MIICLAVLLDLLIGDPPNWPHPVRFIGWLIKTYESFIRKTFKNLYFGGLLLVLMTVGTVVLIYTLVLKISHPYFFKLFEVYILSACLAARCLRDEAEKVRRLIIGKNLEASRNELSYLVGRDTEQLDEKQVLRGIIETVSENTVDGVLAPLFYIFIGAFFHHVALLVLIYKVVNTLDSMVGYIQPPYKEIGFFSAKLDDVLNYIPARLGALLMIVSGGILRLDAINGFKIMIRDHGNHKSPNCGYPEAVTSGLMGIQLGGDNIYFGEVVKKPTLGEAINSLAPIHIIQSVQVIFVSELLLLIMGCSLLAYSGVF